jgi:cob(I)alamin adenosyltransferase
MKIYTKTGDSGETGLFAGPRVSKADRRIEAYGTVDELNAMIGWSRAELPPTEIDAVLARVQHELFAVGAELATPAPDRLSITRINPSHVEALEQIIDRFEGTLPPLTQFILPGGSRAAAAIHLVRTVCRRAERCVVALSQAPDTQISEHLVMYLNRLSDLLFVLARAANSAAGYPDVPWQQPD